jgi:catechol 2,3-dioxygenase-like lactoylglutathione lyase family enzyme
MTSLYPVICSDRLEASRDFYRDLLGLKVVFDDPAFYVLLQSPDDPSRQLGIVHRTHDSVPAAHQVAPRGVLITVEVAAVGPIHDRARALGLPIAQPLRDEAFGQRHFMTVDPDGLLVDVVEPIPFAPEFARRYGLE